MSASATLLALIVDHMFLFLYLVPLSQSHGPRLRLAWPAQPHHGSIGPITVDLEHAVKALPAVAGASSYINHADGVSSTYGLDAW